MTIQKYFPQFEQELSDIIGKEAIFKTIPAGEILVRSGQYIKSTIIVLSGRLKIYRENEEEGGEFLMYYLGAGEACAISMLCSLQSAASEIMAKAEEETEVMLLPIQLAETFIAKYKSWNQFVIQTYRRRFEELLTVIDNIAFRNMDERLEFYLKRHVNATGKKMIELSHQQIADDLNSSREVISRLLKKMEQKNLVKLYRNAVELL
jgi:CRP/FNR family transcriptional regulator